MKKRTRGKMKLCTFLVTYVVILGLLAISGCATIRDQGRMDLFERISNSYGISMRWGRYELAEDFIKTDAEGQQGFDLRELKKIKITSYEHLKSRVSDDRMQVNQTVEIMYFNRDNMKEKTLIDRQIWKYDDTGETWFLHSGFPIFE